MWFITRKRYQKEIDDLKARWGSAHQVQARVIKELERHKQDKNAILKSTEREQVLFDLQSALNLIRDYQHAYVMLSMADPKISQANALLQKYGIAIEEHATYLGFKRTADFHEPDVGDGTAVDLATIAPQGRPKTHWEREEEKWGAEAYGSGTVRIEAEVIDEGEDKEDGFTRAKISFYDASKDE